MRSKYWLLLLLLLILTVVGAFAVVSYHNRRTDSDWAMLFLIRCSEGEFDEARQILADHPEIPTCDFDPLVGTVLHMAAGTLSQPQAVQWLTDAGADVNAEDWRGARPLDVALREENLTAASLILNAGGVPGEQSAVTVEAVRATLERAGVKVDP